MVKNAMINIEEFSKIELKVGKIISAERVAGSEKLLKMSVDLGEVSAEGVLAPRQILAGIAGAYEPEALLGGEAVFVANLEPRRLMGLESQGMILAATAVDGSPVIISPEKAVSPGSDLH